MKISKNVYKELLYWRNNIFSGSSVEFWELTDLVQYWVARKPDKKTKRFNAIAEWAVNDRKFKIVDSDKWIIRTKIVDPDTGTFGYLRVAYDSSDVGTVDVVSDIENATQFGDYNEAKKYKNKVFETVGL